MHASEFEKECTSFINSELPLLDEVTGSMTGMSEKTEHQRSRKTWLGLVSEYSTKNFTNINDRLPALAGLAAHIAGKTNDEFLMGIWKSDMIRGLAWSAVYRVEPEDDSIPPPVAQGRIAGIPTWSWASLNARVAFRPAYFITEPRSTFDIICIGDRGEASSLIERAPTFLYSPFKILQKGVSGTPLAVRATLGHLRVRKATEPKWTGGVRSPISACLYEPIGDVSFGGQIDIIDHAIVFDSVQDTPRSFDPIKCAQLLTWEGDRDREQYAGVILLAPTGKKKNEYRRIGWGDIGDFSIFEKQQAEITLV